MTEINDQLSLENYSPFDVEKKWQEKWESLKAFSPNPCLLYTSPSPRD